MFSGNLRHRVDLQSRVIVQNETGEAVETWSTYGTTWARIAPMTGRERFNAAQFAAEVTHKIHIRYRTQRVKAQDRVVYQGRIFRVDFVTAPEEQNVEFHLLCKEETP
jgi:SPP1 family predicted phage head-tail adaptor